MKVIANILMWAVFCAVGYFDGIPDTVEQWHKMWWVAGFFGIYLIASSGDWGDK